jgi:hypothetical protein
MLLYARNRVLRRIWGNGTRLGRLTIQTLDRHDEQEYRWMVLAL